MKTAYHIFVTVLAICACVRCARADFWGPLEPTEFRSANGKYTLKIEPHPDWPDKPGHCRATLLREGRRVWSRHLINDHGPVQVFVADSGRYVVTMDEWHHVGKLPVVIYGNDGRLIRVHDTDSLGLKDDVLNIKMSISSYWWNEGAVSLFGPDDETFLIRLHWGKWIVLELENGDLLAKEKDFYRDDLRKQHDQRWLKLEEYREKKLAERVVKMLTSDDPEERRTAAVICGEEKYMQAVPQLRKLLADEEYFDCITDWKWSRVFFVREAAKEALQALGQEVDPPKGEHP
ncbi:MAG: hypothetical protein JW809_08750 [Pirellulales bacterium]|nr:hypothetical protein [Pirellulales bacterium]